MIARKIVDSGRWRVFALAGGMFVSMFLIGNAAEPRSGLDFSAVDRSVRPQDDFFRHINGGWIAKTPIPPDRSAYGSFFALRDLSETNLRTIIESAAREADPANNSDAAKVGRLFTSFMNEKLVEKLGKKPIEPDLERVDAVKDAKSLIPLVASLQRTGVTGLFGIMVSNDAKQSDRYIVYLNQGGISLPDESYYRDAKFKPIRDAFLAHVTRMFEIAGIGNAKEKAAQVFSVEAALAKHHWDRVKSRDRTLTYNKRDRKQLDVLAPGYDWSAWFHDFKATGIGEVVVRQPDYFAAMARLLDDLPLDAWKNWVKWHVIHRFAPLLSPEFVNEDFEFFGKRLTGAPQIRPRWKRGVEQVEEGMGMALGKMYVAQHFPPEAKARMQDLVANLIAAYREDIATLDWMSPETRKKAIEKLARFDPKIGYPSKWRDYSALDVRLDDVVGNAQRAAAFEVDRRLALLGKPVDRAEWGMTPQTVNAYYNPGMNEIVFPAAILQPPFFDMHADDAVNYGAIGAVIGHEIGHGFDDQGSKFDGAGNMVNWWTDPDRNEFEARARRLIAQYNDYAPAQLPGQKVNGALTIGENIGDLGGLSIAYKAYRRSLKGHEAPVIDGFSGDQRFFGGWGQAWRSKYRDAELARRLATDPHSPPEFRCNGVVRNLPEFYSTFGVKQGDKLWLPPEQRVRIW